MMLLLKRDVAEGEGSVLRGSRGARWLVVLAAAGTLASASPALAQVTITPVTNDAAGAQVLANAFATNPANVTLASFDAFTSGTPSGIADGTLNDFPRNGSRFSILTSGDVTLADDANTAPDSGISNGGPNVRGTTDFDVTIFRLDLNVPSGVNCLTFDFKFFSDEFPEFVGSTFNDAFIAELDTSTWTTTASAINAPNNFAFDSLGNEISINAAGAASMSAAEATGTTYDGATPLLSASTQVTAGSHALFFSIFDQGDQIFDSAVFLDNLRVGFVPNPAVNCKPGVTPVNFSMNLVPTTAGNPVGSAHTVTATLTDDAGNPVAGGPIQFTVMGTNSATGTEITDAAGQATFTYTGTNVGSDSIAACYDPNSDGACEAVASATKDWMQVAAVLDHFKCYALRQRDDDDDDDDRVARPRVTLKDQWGSSEALVGAAVQFCNPVSKDGGEINQASAHLVKYKAKPVGRKFSKRRVEVMNQFGTQILKVRKPTVLAVPSSKSINGTPGDPPTMLDHFQCYRLLEDDDDDDRNTFTARTVVLRDQFKEEIVRVRRPLGLCNPVEKTHQGTVSPIGSPNEHLVCYAIKARKFARSVNVRNQFGDPTLRVRRPVSLCVPSEKRDLPPPPPDD